MQLGLGVLRWPSDQFWNSTVRELYSGIEGWMEAHGVQKPLSAPTQDQLREMMKKFPDKPKKKKA